MEPVTWRGGPSPGRTPGTTATWRRHQLGGRGGSQEKLVAANVYSPECFLAVPPFSSPQMQIHPFHILFLSSSLFSPSILSSPPSRSAEED